MFGGNWILLRAEILQGMPCMHQTSANAHTLGIFKSKSAFSMQSGANALGMALSFCLWRTVIYFMDG